MALTGACLVAACGLKRNLELPGGKKHDNQTQQDSSTSTPSPAPAPAPSPTPPPQPVPNAAAPPGFTHIPNGM